MRRSSLPVLLALAMLLPASNASAALCDLLTFGAAAKYGGVLVGQGRSSIKGTFFKGDVSFAMTVPDDADNDGRLLDQGDGNVFENGSVDHVPGVELDFDDIVIGGGTNEMNLDDVAADVLNVHLEASSLTPTQSFAGISSATTITGSGGANIIEITDDVSLDGENLTFSGTSSDFFVINVQGKFEMKSGAAIVLDGIESTSLLFNVTTPGEEFKVSDSTWYGTVINPSGKVSMDTNLVTKGAFVASRLVVKYAEFDHAAFQCPSCPDPEISGANLGTPAVPRSRSKSISPFFLPYFDADDLGGHLEAFRVGLDGTIVDQDDDPVFDSTTNLPVADRNPDWDAGVLLNSDDVRNLYTTVSGARAAFNTTNVTQAMLDIYEDPALFEPTYPFDLYPNYANSGVDTYPELHAAIILRVHGDDPFDEDGNSVFLEMRDDVMGDSVHANPMLIGTPPGGIVSGEDGYGDFFSSYGERDRVIYLGANDGMLHAFDAGDYWDGVDEADFDPGTGTELFGYIPAALLDKLKYRMIDIKQFNPMVDGPLVAADAWLGDGTGTDTTKSGPEWATVVIQGYREGGAGYLALDVTDPAANAAPHGPYPKLLWEFTDSNLGESWSAPVITRVKVKGVASSGDKCGDPDGDGDCREQWVAIFGGGYDTTGDPNTAAYKAAADAGFTGLSKAIYMVALDTGAVLAKVAYDSTGTNGPTTMVYSIPSEPAVLDVDFDGFADVVYVGDLGGQMWKWDITSVGVDADANQVMDNWNYGVFFKSAPEPLTSGGNHYRSFFFSPSAAFLSGKLTLAFGAGERNNTIYAGDASEDENNRFYVVRDVSPTGASAFPGTLLEGNLTDVTALDSYTNPGNSGYFLKVADGEKFITDVATFAGYVLAGSYVPDTSGSCGPGDTYLYVFKLATAEGFFPVAGPPADDRRTHVGEGIPSTPRVSVAPSVTDDKIYIKTSEGEVLTLDAPPRSNDASVIYWRQR